MDLYVRLVKGIVFNLLIVGICSIIGPVVITFNFLFFVASVVAGVIVAIQEAWKQVKKWTKAIVRGIFHLLTCGMFRRRQRPRPYHPQAGQVVTVLGRDILIPEMPEEDETTPPLTPEPEPMPPRPAPRYVGADGVERDNIPAFENEYPSVRKQMIASWCARHGIIPPAKILSSAPLAYDSEDFKRRFPVEGLDTPAPPLGDEDEDEDEEEDDAAPHSSE
ncbi:hypothetical protein MKZ38_003206 [Zalerion maritima]|uniref:Uncharacterized protein n=1 Tax=Zalerion maritima TaxID=339359 RepID=A0AAD5WXQ6_9PEZI|nr:hypothetical protein MKZ38_003206 [Zalerion maritima]